MFGKNQNHLKVLCKNAHVTKCLTRAKHQTGLLFNNYNKVPMIKMCLLKVLILKPPIDHSHNHTKSLGTSSVV